MKIESYKDLQVWQRAMDLAEMAYRVTKSFPKDELFGMTSQIRRAAVSIPANIAEGWGRNNPGDFSRFLDIAQGSLKELETHLILSQRTGLVQEPAIPPLLDLANVLGKQVHALQASVAKRRPN